MAFTFFPATSSESGFGEPVPVYDAFALFNECQAHGISTDWWFPLANSVEVIAGEPHNTAYLLLAKKHIDGCAADKNNGVALDPISRTRYSHRIALQDSVRLALGNAPMNIDGWVFHSARAIDGASDPLDLDAIYLVKFVDKRWLFAKQPAVDDISGALLQTYRTGFNVISMTRDDEEMEYDPGLADDFPYIGDTVGTSPRSWRTVLEALWLDTGFLDNSGATMGFQNDLLPDGGDYPNECPIDLLPENDTTWSYFCKVLHASGNEIFPLLDGTYRILPIDDHFGSDSDLTGLEAYLIEAGHVVPNDRLLPANVSLTYRLRDRNEDSELTNVNTYITPTIYKTSPAAAYGTSSPLLTSDEVTDSGCSILNGTFGIGDGAIPGIHEDFTSIGMAIVEPGYSSSSYFTHIDNYARNVLTKLLKSRADNQVDSTYGYFINQSPTPEFERISWFLLPGGPATRFESLSSSIGVDKLPYRGAGSGGRDRLVAADETDDVPNELIDKIEDDQPPGTYNALTHQIVWAEVVTHGTAPTLNNQLRFYTTLGTGVPGPPGSPGADGSDGADGDPGPTYTDGCGIIVAGTVISFDPVDVISLGLQIDPSARTTCSIAFKPSDAVGCGLAVASDNGTTAVKMKFDPTVVVAAGGGLAAASDNSTVAAGPCKLKINPADLCGAGLAEVAGNQADGNGPVKIKVNPNLTIRDIQSGTLARVGDNLVLTLSYREVQVYGIVGADGTITATIAGTDCES